MKSIKVISSVIVILFLALTAFSQRKLSGKVVEVIDGRTAVVEIGTSGKLKVVLQNIETPEPEQPLHGVVKEHLEKFLLGKNADVFPKGLVNSVTVAQVFVGNVDVSQQMLRDGAAWYALPEKTDKKNAESEIYLSNEAQAKAEKRGVWGIEGLKPAWEFRAEKQQRERVEELARLEEMRKQNQEKYPRVAKKKLPPPPVTFSNYEMWKSGRTAGIWDEMQLYMGDKNFNENGLFIYKVPSINLTMVTTKDTQVNLSNGSVTPLSLCALIYATGKPKDAKEEKEVFVMGCRSRNEKQSFKSSDQLVITNDGKKITFGKALHLGNQSDNRFNEMIVYFLDRDSVTKIAAAKNVQIKIGEFSGVMTKEYHSMIKHLVIESANEIK